MGDSRRDGGTRDRIDHLVDDWHAAIARLDARYRRVTWLLMLTLAAAIIASAVGAAAFWTTQHREERDRYRAVYGACLARNATAESVGSFLHQIHASKRTEDVAAKTFVVTPSCRKYSVALLGRPAPEGAFNLPPGADREALRTPTPPPRP